MKNKAHNFKIKPLIEALDGIIQLPFGTDYWGYRYATIERYGDRRSFTVKDEDRGKYVITIIDENEMDCLLFKDSINDSYVHCFDGRDFLFDTKEEAFTVLRQWVYNEFTLLLDNWLV